MKLPCSFNGESLGCVTWLCCLTGSLIFGAILLSTTPLLDAPQWAEDVCTVVAHDDRCLGLQLLVPDCRVSLDVSLLADPDCVIEVVPCTDCAEWKPKTVQVQRCMYRTAKIFSKEETGAASLNWLKVHAVNSTDACFYQVANETNVEFQLPDEMVLTNSDILLAALPALFFWVSACFVLPAYMEPNSYQGRTLAKLGFARHSKNAFEIMEEHHETFSVPGGDNERDDVALVTKQRERESERVSSNIVMTRRDEDEQSMEDSFRMPQSGRRGSLGRRGSEIIGQSMLLQVLQAPPVVGP